MASQKLLSVGTKIIGVGRNYVAHAKELGNAVPKVFFFPPPFLSKFLFVSFGGEAQITH
jgi:2-keto-4-pentenoate hydratase/2-oxohepta-3-ene-1,7-dioic acid hydratase in catechol pathway